MCGIHTVDRTNVPHVRGFNQFINAKFTTPVTEISKSTCPSVCRRREVDTKVRKREVSYSFTTATPLQLRLLSTGSGLYLFLKKIRYLL